MSFLTRAVVFAYHDVGVRCLSVLLAHGVDVPLVVTHEDDPGENVWFGSVATFAREHDIETITPSDPNTAEIAVLLGRPGDKIRSLEELRSAARELRGQLGCAVLAKGGHLPGRAEAPDIFWDGREEMVHHRVDQAGHGCLLMAK